MNICLLTGIPNAGIDICSEFLKQNSQLHISQSPAFNVMAQVIKYANNTTEKNNLVTSIFNLFYKNNHNVVDVSYTWNDIKAVEFISDAIKQRVKIIAVVRNIEDVIANYVSQQNPKDLSSFLKNNEFVEFVKTCYQHLWALFDTHKDSICIVEYDNLIANPKQELGKVHQFLRLYEFNYCVAQHAPTNLDAKSVLKHHYYKFCQPRFWIGEEKRDIKSPLDDSLHLSLVGNQDEAAQLLDKLIKQEPENDRTAFNYGWYLLKRGNLLEGHKYIARGRNELVFGNDKPNGTGPVWDGKTKGTVLLYLEGGLGDQIHGAGMARYIVSKGCDVVLSCSRSLGPAFKNIKGIKGIVSHEGASEVLHDFYVPSMSAVIPLGIEYKDVDGSAYIPKPKLLRGNKVRIGLRWQGNPQFEHEQHRLFPSKLLFDALQEFSDVEFVSLQCDEGAENRPDWVKQVPLNSWTETQYAIASCDLVISSCTSVAHMSAAMGVDTWIVIPVLPYYLWAKPGSKTEWYDSVTLFRQETYGDWKAPFVKINHELKLKLGEQNAYQNRILGSSSQRKCGAVLGLQAATG